MRAFSQSYDGRDVKILEKNAYSFSQLGLLEESTFLLSRIAQ